jgi:hypothetical protein
VFSKPDIKKLFQPYRLVRLYTDEVPNEYYAPSLRAAFGSSTARQTEDARVNLAFQAETFKTSQRPLYVILEPRPAGSVQVVRTYDVGKINDVGAFARFLEEPVAGR